MQLRPYQLEAVENVIAARRRGVQRMLVCLPTGAGKTVIFSELIRRARHDVLVLAHREELLHQARTKIEAALRRHGDPRRVEIERGAQRARAGASVLVASIRSLHPDRIGPALRGRDLRLVIYDECHHAVAEANRAVLERVGVFQPDWPGTLVGFTATTRRGDGQGLGQVFEEIVAERSLPQMIADGYLRPLRGLRVQTGVSLDAVSLRGDDFDEDELAEAVDVESRNQLVARSIIELARDRRTIAFCVTVAHAERLCAALRRLGVPAALVCGDMPRDARVRTLRRFREGGFAVVCNVGVLTEGFDDPGVSCIAMVRPTRSEALYLQCVGRGMRLDPSAPDCLVLDFVDLSQLSVVTTATLEDGPGQGDPDDDEDGAAAVGRMPLEDDDRDEAPATLQQIILRLSAFDPLTLQQREEAAAISLHGWISLGVMGMKLHFLDHDGQLQAFELRPVGRSSVEVWLGTRKLTRLPSMQAAIEAVDLELPRYGDGSSARADAVWRRAPVTAELRASLAALRPPRLAHSVGEALEHLELAHALEEVAKRRR